MNVVQYTRGLARTMMWYLVRLGRRVRCFCEKRFKHNSE
jgi:hypothetical protein